MTTFLVIRPKGPSTRAIVASGSTFIETSIEEMRGRSWILEDIEMAHLGAVVLEDQRIEELDDEVRTALLRASAGHSCPIVTRWTRLREGDAR